MLDISELMPCEEQEEEQPKEEPKIQVIVTFPPTKDQPIEVIRGAQVAVASDPIDMSAWNRAHIEVSVNGATPSATVTAKGHAQMAGRYIQLPDSAAQQTAVSDDRAFDVQCGSPWMIIDLSSVSGTFGAGSGYSVSVTRYNA